MLYKSTVVLLYTSGHFDSKYTVSHFYTGWLKKSKLLILAVNEIKASQTRVNFAKCIPKLVEKMFDMCSIVPNYSFSILNFFIKILAFLLILPIITI